MNTSEYEFGKSTNECLIGSDQQQATYSETEDVLCLTTSMFWIQCERNGEEIVQITSFMKLQTLSVFFDPKLIEGLKYSKLVCRIFQ